MHGKKSCWEVIEDSMLRKHKTTGKRVMYPLFTYIQGHFKFFHQGEEDLQLRYAEELQAWRQGRK